MPPIRTQHQTRDPAHQLQGTGTKSLSKVTLRPPVHPAVDSQERHREWTSEHARQDGGGICVTRMYKLAVRERTPLLFWGVSRRGKRESGAMQANTDVDITASSFPQALLALKSFNCRLILFCSVCKGDTCCSVVHPSSDGHFPEHQSTRL